LNTTYCGQIAKISKNDHNILIFPLDNEYNLLYTE